MKLFLYVILLSGLDCIAMFSCFTCFTSKHTIDSKMHGCELDNIEYKDAIPFIPPVTQGKVIKVYDGDTITIASRLPIINSPMYRFSVRLTGIDSAEIKGKTFAEKEAAVKARDALRDLIFGKVVTLRNVSTEKYGRILATVYLGDVNICEWMLEHKYAVPYDGGTKQRPSEWDRGNPGSP